MTRSPLAQLPVEVVGDLDTEIVMRIESAGAAGALCQAAQDAKIACLVGFDLFTGVRESILRLPEDAWRPAIRQDGQERDGAQIAEITPVERLLDLTPWPEGSRVIIRRGFGYHSPWAVIALAMLSLCGLCPPLPGR